MKKSQYLIIVILLLLTARLSGQNAIGLRIGAGGAEISFQTSNIFPDRLEADIGWSWSPGWNSCIFTGIYQWVFPIESGFNWHAGAGAALGLWSYTGREPEKYNGGISLALVLNGGAEYNFTEIPVQLSLDLRLTPYLLSRGATPWFDLGIGIRYLF